MSFELVGVRLIAEDAAKYNGDLAAGDKATDAFSASTAVAAAKVNVFDDSLKKIKIGELTNKLTEQQKALGILQQDLSATAQKYGEGSIQAQKKQLAVDKLSNSIGITEQKIQRENTALDQEKAAFDAAAHAASAAAPAVDQLGKSTKTAGDDAEQSAPKWKGMSEIAIGALRRIGEIAINAFMQASQAAVGFFKDSISAAGDFQQNFAEFGNAVGHTIDGTGLKLDDFKKQFISLGKELPVSTSDVEKAAIEMARGGIDPAVIAGEGLRRTIQFASAAMKGDLVGAAQISAKTMQAWTNITDDAKTKTDFLSHAQDLLTQSTTAASTTVDQLFLGLSNVGGTARLAGVSFDETVKSLAQLTPSFASSADAGTSLKTFFSRLQPETKPAIAAMQALGLWSEKTGSAFYDAQGKFVGVAKAEDLLHNATKDLTDAQRESVLQQIFGNDAIRAAAVFAQQGAAGYNALSDSISKQTTLTDAAKNNQSTFNTALENAKGSVEALQITLGTELLPVLTDVFNNYIAPAINQITTLTSALFGDRDAFAQLSPAMQGVEQSLVAVYAGVLSFIQGLSDAYAAITPIIDLITANLTPILTGLAAIFVAVVVPAFVAWAGAAATAAAATIAAMAPVVIPIVAIGAAVALLTKAWQEDWGGIQEETAKVWNVIEPIFSAVQDWLGKNIPKAVSITSDFWTNTLWPALQKVWSFIQGDILPIFATLFNWLGTVIPPAVAELANFWSNILWPALEKVWNFISTFLVPLFAALVNVQIAILQQALKELSAVWTNYLLPAITTAYNWFNDHIVPIFDSVSNKGTEVGSVIRDKLGPAFQWLNDNILSPVAGWLSTIASNIKDLIGWLNDLADKIRNMPSLPSAFQGNSPPPMANWMNDIAGGAQNAAGAFQNTSNAMRQLPASPAMLMNGGNTNNTTNNNQRNVNLNYNTQYAPPPATSLAIANALAY
jgi:TP901 family phage tail tape measure protein